MTTSTRIPAAPPTSVPEQIQQHDLAALALEAAAVAATAGGLRGQLQVLTRSWLLAWHKAFGSLHSVQSGLAFLNFMGRVQHDLAHIRYDPTSSLLDYTARAHELGVKQGFREAGEKPEELPGPASLTTVAGANQAAEKAAQQLDTAVRMAGTARSGSFTAVTQAAAPAQQAANEVERTARTMTNTALNDGIADVAEHVGGKLLWLAERDACFIPSTRVLAPSVLGNGPMAAPELVATDPLDGFTLDPTALGVVLGGDPGAPPTPAVAGPVRDRFGQVKAVTSREYVGDVVRIRTASGKELTGTPNHPIATRGGWVPLGELKVGDHVFSRSTSERVNAGIHPDDNDAPPTIQEVAQSFPVPVRVVPTAAEDFHGDGSGSEVHVVRTNRFLLNEVDADCPEHRSELPLGRGDVQLLPLAGQRLGDLGSHGALASTVGRGGSLDNLPASLGTERVGATEVLPDRQVVALEPALDSQHVDVVEHGYFLERLAGLVEPDQIVEVWRGEFSGQVLNLETKEGWYLAEDIVAHNCVTCLALSGHTVDVGEEFDVNATFGKTPIRWIPDGGLTGPPRHPSCRCRVSPWLGSVGPTPVDLPQALRREAERSVIKGGALPSESERVRRDAAVRLLSRIGMAKHSRSPSGWAVPQSVKERAERALRRGTFTTGPVPVPGKK